MFSSAVLICDVKRLPSKTLYKNPIQGFHDSVLWGLQAEGSLLSNKYNGKSQVF